MEMQVTEDDLRSYYEDVRDAWEFEHEGMVFPLRLDFPRSLESELMGEVLHEIEVSRHLSGLA